MIAAIAVVQIPLLVMNYQLNQDERERSYRHGLTMRDIAVSAKPVYDRLRELRKECRRRGLDCAVNKGAAR